MSEQIIINLDADVANDDGTFTPLPKGWYDVVIEDVELKKSNSEANKGKPMYGYKFKVEEGEYAGRIIFTNACLWPEAIFTQKGIQTALGTWKKGETQFKVDQIDDLKGKSLKVKVDIREYKGEETNDVKSFLSADGKAPASGAKKKSGGFSL